MGASSASTDFSYIYEPPAEGAPPPPVGIKPPEYSPVTPGSSADIGDLSRKNLIEVRNASLPEAELGVAEIVDITGADEPFSDAVCTLAGYKSTDVRGYNMCTTDLAVILVVFVVILMIAALCVCLCLLRRARRRKDFDDPGQMTESGGDVPSDSSAHVARRSTAASPTNTTAKALRVGSRPHQ